jgi:sterol desaturase/sphingolipid hydroxylase (fatty acid hydroxylase superfamily)
MAGLFATFALVLFFLVVLTVIEHIGPRERYPIRSRVLGATFNLIGVGLAALITYGLITGWHRFVAGPIVKVPLAVLFEPLGPFATVGAIVVLVTLIDFLHYWRHRLEHYAFWRIHKIHHAATELHAANSIGHPLQAVPEFLVVTAPLALFAFDGPAVPVAVSIFISFSARFVHSPINFHLGPFRYAFVDNRYHRIHHSLESQHFGKNFGIFLTVWDQLFGTAYFPAADEWPDTGVKGLEPPRSVRQFLLMPLR